MAALGDELVITSPANPRVKALLALRRRRERDQSGTTLLEGYEELSLAVADGVVPRALYYCPELMRGALEQDDVVRRVAALGVPVTRLSRAAFEKAAYREGPDGFLAVVPQPGGDLATVEAAVAGVADPLILVCEHVEKPGNLGAMLRTADAAGVHAVIAADPVTDWGNPNVVRASKGTVFTVPVAQAPTSQVLAWLGARGIPLVATTPDTDLVHTDAPLAGPVAIAVGAEKTGLGPAALRGATYRVRIPMAGRADSLNVSTSAAIVLFEAVRQRRARAAALVVAGDPGMEESG